MIIEESPRTPPPSRESSRKGRDGSAIVADKAVVETRLEPGQETEGQTATQFEEALGSWPGRQSLMRNAYGRQNDGKSCRGWNGQMALQRSLLDPVMECMQTLAESKNCRPIKMI